MISEQIEGLTAEVRSMRPLLEGMARGSSRSLITKKFGTRYAQPFTITSLQDLVRLVLPQSDIGMMIEACNVLTNELEVR